LIVWKRRHRPHDPLDRIREVALQHNIDIPDDEEDADLESESGASDGWGDRQIKDRQMDGWGDT
jgi:hypothetical protein